MCTCLPSSAPMQLGKSHWCQKSATCFRLASVCLICDQQCNRWSTTVFHVVNDVIHYTIGCSVLLSSILFFLTLSIAPMQLGKSHWCQKSYTQRI